MEDSAFTIKCLALLAGSIGGVSRWFSEILAGTKPFIVWHLPMVLTIGGFMGFLGGELATAVLNSPHLAGLVGGTSGAMGSYGFDWYIKRLTKL